MTKILKWLGAVFIGFLIFKGLTTEIKVEATTVGQLTKERSSITGRMEFRHNAATQNTFEDYIILKVNGEIVFCLDPTMYVAAGQYIGEEFKDVEQITERIKIDRNLQVRLALITYYGYKQDPSHRNYHYTQALIWENLGWWARSFSGGLSMAEYQAWKAATLAEVNGHRSVASFTNQTHTLKVGESITLTDTNNVLQNLTIPATQNGYDFTRNGNQLTITATKDAVDEKVTFSQPRSNLIHGNSIVFRKPGSQTVASLKLIDPQYASVNLRTVKKAQIVINKTSSTTSKGIAGVEFTLYDATTNAVVKTAVTNANGVAEFLDLDADRKFYFKETRAAKGYMLNETRYDYVAVAGETKTFNIKNEPVPTMVSKAATVNGTKKAFAHDVQHERLTVSDLTIGNTYTLVSFQMDKNSRRQLSETQKVTFKATSNTYTHTFAYNNIASTYTGDVVYGAWLYSADGKKIAEHFDFENKAQTVTVVKPGMTSTATGPNGQKTVHAIDKQTEEVEVTGLIENLNYRLVSFAMSGTNKKQIGDFQSVYFTPTSDTYTHTFTYNNLQPTYHGDVIYGARLYYGNRLLHEHFDFNNKAQTVNVITPTIVTVATTQNGNKSGYRDEKHIEKATIRNVIPGRTYTLIARQYDKSGKLYATQTRTVKPTANTHVETFEFTVPAGFSGYLVYAQELLENGKQLANHFDLNNASQTVYVDEPEVTTVATTVTGGKVGYEYEDHKEIANVTGLIIGRQYKLVATQYDKTGKAYATQEATFTATTKTYTHEFIFTVPVGFKGHLVYGEELYDGADKVAVHYDLENKDQTVEIIEPDVVTEATTQSGGKVGYQYEDHKEVATMTGLIIGRKYKVVATQYDENGKVYATQEREFTADKTERTEVFTFKVPVSFTGTIVYGEDLYSEGKKIATHYDLKSIPQSVKVITPAITTQATTVSGGKVGYEYEDHKEIAVIKDLIVGREYEVVATQYDKTGKAYATQKATFTAKESTHTHEFIFSVPKGFKGYLVYGETLSYNGKVIATHYDLENKDQTVEIIEPDVVTEATTQSGGKVGYQYEDHKEVATMTGLIVGRKYKVVATQYDETGKVYATQEREFTADKTEHTEVFTFKVPVSFTGTIVYGEDLYFEGKKIATHYDLKSIPQSVKVVEPTISTVAKVGGKTELVKGQKVTVTDTLTYTNFKNEEVAIKTWIVKYGTDEKVSEVYTRIVKLNGNGEVTITLDGFDTSKLPVGKYTLMEQVFEVKDGQVTEQLISQHTNNKDEKQTFSVTEPELPEAGMDDNSIVVMIGILSLLFSYVITRKLSKKCE